MCVKDSRSSGLTIKQSLVYFCVVANRLLFVFSIEFSKNSLVETCFWILKVCVLHVSRYVASLGECVLLVPCYSSVSSSDMLTTCCTTSYKASVDIPS